MPNTFELIASSTVGAGGAANITFSSIPGTYTDLVVKVSARTGRTGYNGDGVVIKFNGNNSSYSTKIIQGDGSSVISDGNADSNAYGTAVGPSATSNTFSNAEWYIPNYAGSNNKSVSVDGVTETNGNPAYTGLTALLWSNTSAITSIALTTASTTNFSQYTTAYLYGVKNA